MLKSVGKRLIIQKIEEDKKDEKKPLILTVNEEKKPYVALVIAIGSEVDDNVHEGDYVLVDSGRGLPIEIDGVKYLSIYEDHILVVKCPDCD